MINILIILWILISSFLAFYDNYLRNKKINNFEYYSHHKTDFVIQLILFIKI
jgi:hypothetical protein